MPSYIFRRTGMKGIVSYTVRFPTGELTEKGNPATTSKTFRYLRQAQDHLQTLKDAARAGGAVVESEQSLTDFFDEYIEAADIRDNTRTNYRESFNRYVKPVLGKTSLKDITPRKVQNLFTPLKKTLAPSTVKLAHSVLRSCLQHALDLKLIRTNPAVGTKLARRRDADIRFLQGEELTEFLEVIKGNPYQPLFEFLLSSGCRPGEGRALQWGDLDFKKNSVTIERTVSDKKPWNFQPPKTSKGRRVVGLPEQTMKMLALHKREQEERAIEEPRGWNEFDLVFPSETGEPLDRRNLSSRYLKPALKQVGDKLYPKKDEPHKRLLGVNMYSLRHTHGTKLVETGVSIKLVSERLGHADIATTLRYYVHSTKAMEREAIEKIAEALYG
jgi:integrase